MWYAVQTIAGGERKLIDSIERIADRQSYRRCFYMRREAVWRRQGECVTHIETLFPGYIFIETETPGKFYGQLKKVPEFSKLLGKESAQEDTKADNILKKTDKSKSKDEKRENDSESIFYPIAEEERSFLERLTDGDEENTVRLSPVRTDEDGNITECEGALRYYRDRIVKKRIRLRYVILRIKLMGRDRDIKIGIRLVED